MKPVPSRGDVPQAAVYGILVLVQFLFSGWHVLGKIALNDGCDPLVFALYREVSATTLMLLLARCTDGTVALPAWGGEGLRYVACGFAMYVNVVGFIMALEYVPPTVTAAWQPAIPVWASAIAVVVRLERPTPTRLIGVVIAAGGALVMSVVGGEDDHDGGDGSNPLLGNAILAVQTLGMGSYFVLQRPLARRHPSATVTFWSYAGACAFTALTSVSSAARSGGDAALWELGGGWTPWAALAYAAVFATFFNYTAYTWANRRSSVTVVSLFSTVQPLATAVLSCIFLPGTTITPMDGLGAALIVLGMCVVLRAKWAEERTAEVGEALAADGGADAGDALSTDLPTVDADGVGALEREKLLPPP